MAKKLYEESNIQAIADAIRTKNGTSKTYKTSEMAAAISAITTGDGSGNCTGLHIPEEGLIVSGSTEYQFSNNNWNCFIETCGDRITTDAIYPAGKMFYNSSTLQEIPFVLNFSDLLKTDCDQMFYGCKALKYINKISNLYAGKMGSMFYNCNKLRYLPEFENLNLTSQHNNKTGSASNTFYGCRSLRSVPESFLKEFHNMGASTSYCHLYGIFHQCNALDEIIGLSPQSGELTINMFGTTSNGSFVGCSRIKNLIFDTNDDGTPFVANWKGQEIWLTEYVGYYLSDNVTTYNSGITEDKKVTDDATYQALKNDPDWYTTDPAYSRYNHDSAVATINSLPDTSAYLASSGGTNKIYFKGSQGSATDGGAINTLTAAEVKVANDKGWTVYVDKVEFTGI